MSTLYFDKFVKFEYVLQLTVNMMVCQVAVSMFGYMTEIDTVEMTDTQEIEADGEFWYTSVTPNVLTAVTF